jgi:NitT/TauT family transport system permease protein
MAMSAASAPPRRGQRRLLVVVLRLVLAGVILAGWEAYGRLVDSSLTSTPSDIAAVLAGWARSVLWLNLGVTLFEIVAGLVLGVPVGIVAGLFLGRARVAGALLRPIVVLFYSVPFIALTPLLIMWFGVGSASKVMLIALSSFFLLFFNTFAGAQEVDPDLVAIADIMGASRRERFVKVIAPACAPRILSGLKTALPFALIGAVIGEMLAARAGLGNLLMDSGNDFDMAGLYAALAVLMVVGVVLNVLAQRLETWLLRWRP